MFDPNIIKIIVAVVMILLDVAVVGIGIVYLLFGMLFGTRKSLRRALSFLIPFLIFIISINFLTNSILSNSTIFLLIDGNDITVQEFLVNLLSNYLAEFLYNGNVAAAQNSEIIALATSLVKTILRLVIYLIGLFIIAFIVAPFIRFICWISYRIQIKGKPKEKMPWASRIGGMGIASVRYIVLLLILIVPISGGISMVHMLVEDARVVIETIDEEEVQVDGGLELAEEILVNVDEGFDFSLSRQLFKLTRGKENEASVDMQYLGSFFNIKTKNAKLNILKEYGQIHTLIPTAASLYSSISSSEEINYEDIINALEQKDVQVLAHVLKDSELLNLTLPVAYDYLAYYLEEEGILEENNITPEMIHSIEINSDFDQIVEALAIVLDIVVTENLHFEKTEELLEIIITNEKIANNLQTFIDDILTTSTIQNIGLPLASSYIINVIESSEEQSLKDLIPLLSAERLNLYLENDINEIFIIANNIYSSPLKEIINCLIRGEELSSIYIDFTDQKVTSVVESTLVKLMSLNLIHGNENIIVKVLMQQVLDEYDVNLILFDESGNPRIDWSKETNVIATTLVTLLETFGEDLIFNLTNSASLILTLLDSHNAEEIVDTITMSDFVKSLVVTFIYDFVSKSEDIPENFKNVLNKEALEKCFEEDIVTLIHSVQAIYETSAKEQIVALIKGEGFDINAINFANEDVAKSLEDAFTSILNLSIIEGNEEVFLEYVITIVNDSNDIININAQEILYDESGNKYIDWDQETRNTGKIIVDALSILNGNITGDFDAIDYLDMIIVNSKTEQLLEEITSSQLIRKVVVTILSQYIESGESIPADFKEILTKESIEEVFEKDVLVLYNILVDLYNSPLKDDILNTFLNNKTFNPDFENKDVQDTFKDVITRIVKLSIIKGNEEVLIKTLMANIEGIDFDLDSVLYDENGNKYLDWESEINTLCDALIEVINVLGSDFANFSFEMLQEKVLNDKEKTKHFVNTISESEIVRVIILDLMPDLISQTDMIPEEILAFFTEEKFNALREKETFKEEVNLLLDVVIDILELGITDFNNFEITLEKQPLLKATLNKLIQSSFIKGEEEELIKAFISGIEGINLDLDSVLYDENGNKYLDWESEINTLCDALFEVINVLGSNFEEYNLELLEEKLLSDEEKTKHFVNTISESEIIRAVILDMIPDLINETEMLPSELASFFTKEKFDSIREKETFKEEMNLLLDVVGDLLELGITDFSSFDITSENQALLKGALKKLIDSAFIKGEEEELFKLFMDTTNFTGMLEENDIVLDYTNVTNWHDELVISIDIALGFVDISTSDNFAIGDLFEGNMTEEEITKVANLFDQIGESELFKPIVYQLISNVGYDINITEEDKVLIEANGFGNEIKSLLEVIGGAQTLLEAEDLTTLKGSDVKTLMLEASNGIITSKVVGELLETALGPDGLNINPKDEQGNLKYDFTNPQTLKDQAENIANLIDLANSMNNFDISNSTSVTDVTEALKGLENNELAEDALEELTGIEVDLGSMDIAEEATIIENAYQEYINSEDQENFVPSEEVIKQIEDSNIAGAILDILGIYSQK